jgi:hypothetical protein
LFGLFFTRAGPESPKTQIFNHHERMGPSKLLKVNPEIRSAGNSNFHSFALHIGTAQDVLVILFIKVKSKSTGH